MPHPNRYFHYKHALIFGGEPHLETRLTEAEAVHLLHRSGALLLRNTFHFDNTANRAFWYIIKDHWGGMEELSSRTRNKVRHAQHHFHIRRITRAELPALLENFASPLCGKNGKRIENILLQKANANTASPTLEHWGCLCKTNGNLAAYAVNIVHKDSCFYSDFQAHSRFLTGGYYPLYGLLHTMNEYYLTHERKKYVSDGSRTITERSEVQDFLCRTFRFRKAYTDLSITYQPSLRLLLQIAYPFRRMLPSGHLKSLLRQEEMHRQSKTC